MISNRIRVISLIFVLIIGASQSSSATQPADFTIRAAFFPGGGRANYKDSEPWKLTIRENGEAVQEISIIGSPPYPRRITKSFRLSQKQLANLARIIESARFFSLPTKVSKSDAEHYAGCVLDIAVRGRTHKVKFIWPTDEKATHDRVALTQFWKVWREVLKMVPSPNHNSEAVWWLQHVRPDLVSQTR